MDPHLVQRSRYLLQARVRRAKSCPSSLFIASCRYLLQWLRAHQLISPIVADLSQVTAEYTDRLREWEERTDARIITADTVRHHAVMSLAVLDWIVTAQERSPDIDEEDFVRRRRNWV